MRIYLLNNTKPYHDEDDGYSGDWFHCPVNFEEVREKLCGGSTADNAFAIVTRDIYYSTHKAQ